MKTALSLFMVLLVLAGCGIKPRTVSPGMSETYVLPATFEALPGWNQDEASKALQHFKTNCQAGASQKLFGELCNIEVQPRDALVFFETQFEPYRIMQVNGDDTPLLTGYYEPLLHGSLEQSDRYRYPVYGVPDDLIIVELAALYPELKGLRLRGRLDGNRLLPYADREAITRGDLPVLCWVDDRVSLFFLEVQGSGRIALDNGDTMYVGYANQNGHPYRSIGKYLIEQGALTAEEVSLRSIRQWLREHPDSIDEVLNHNPSQIFFSKKAQPATGALGLVLTPERSIAVDRHYIPLGTMLYLESQDPVTNEPIAKTVFAQDTGGAIKGEVRADYFWGFGLEAEEKAGGMKAPLTLWILLPKVD
jgi:membrane-bound lytic murein transglycosylase A